MNSANPSTGLRAHTGKLIGALVGALLLVGVLLAAVLIGAVFVLGATSLRPADAPAEEQPALEAR